MIDDITEMESHAGAAATLLRTLANEKRLLILCKLSDGEKSVSDIDVGLSQSALSQHLAVLRSKGVVGTRREKQTIYYHIADPDAARVMAVLADIFCNNSSQKE